MIPRLIPCRIESCGECLYWEFTIHGCGHPDYPRLNRYLRDSGTIPMWCPLPEAPEEEDDEDGTP